MGNLTQENILLIARSMIEPLGASIAPHRYKYKGNYYNNIGKVIHISFTDQYGKPRPLNSFAFSIMHEVAHALQQHRGIFKPYFTMNRKNPEFKRIALRAERHANKTAYILCNTLGLSVNKKTYLKTDLYRYFGWS